MAFHILIIEDDPNVRVLLRRVLEREGYKVSEASDGLEGLKAIEARSPDLMIVDMTMPRLDGITLTKAVKSQPHTKHIPVILLTANIDSESMEAGLSSGAYIYLSKPFQVQEVLAQVNRALAESH